MKTMIAVILDRSGSMAGRESDVITGVNHFIDEQKKIVGAASIAFSRFDAHAIERFRPMSDIQGATYLTVYDYQPRGGTPLNDAIGQELEQLEHDWRRERPDRCIVVIVTDGHENASSRFTKAKIKSMIEARQESGKWGFIYLGANVDAFDEAVGLGIWVQNSGGYTSSARGTAAMYANTSSSVGTMRTTGVMDAHLGGNIDEDGSLKPFDPNFKPAVENTTAPWTPPPATPSGEAWKEPT